MQLNGTEIRMLPAKPLIRRILDGARSSNDPDLCSQKWEEEAGGSGVKSSLAKW